MAKYRIGVFWMEAGNVEIEADNPAEALKKAVNANLSDVERWGYIDDSFRVDEDDIEEVE